jgi:death on curing protein
VTEPIWIDAREAIVLHDRLIAIEGGPAGIRDAGLLESALARPRQLRTYDPKASIVEMAAAYMAGVIRNHPFIDGNKRVGFVIGVLFLEINGYSFTASEEDAAGIVMDLAAGAIDEPGFAAWLHGNVERN